MRGLRKFPKCANGYKKSLEFFPVFLMMSLICSFVFILPTSASASKDLTIASAGKNGTYYKLANLLAERFNQLSPDRQLKVIETKGSRENASLMEKGQIDFAIMQNDVAYLASYYSSATRGVASLYTEPVHILCRSELPWETVSDAVASGKNIAVGTGPNAGGTFAHANAILKNAQINQENLSLDNSSFAVSLQKLKDRQLDILFYTISSPSEIIAQFADKNIVKLLELGAPLLRKTKKDYPFFVLTEIPYDHYHSTSTNLQTLGVRALLVANSKTHDEDVLKILEILFSLNNVPATLESVVKNISTDDATLGMNVPLHEAAKHYYQRDKNKILTLLLDVWNYLLPVGILLTVLIFLIKAPRLLNIVHQYTFGRLLLFSLLIWLVGASLMFLFEGSRNQNFDTFGKASIAILYYLSSGLEAKYPVTTVGHITSIVILTLGIAMVTYFTSILVTELVKKSFGVSTLIKKPKYFFRLKNHVVIIGWGERTKRVIGQLRKNDIKVKPTILVVTAKANETHIVGRKKYKDVWVVEGSISTPETLESANLMNAKTALVFSEHPMLPESDNKLIVAGMEIDRINPGIHSIVEALRPECNSHLKNCKVDEIINMSEIGSMLLSQCVISPGILDFYNQVAAFGLDSQEFYFAEVPEIFYDYSFQELQKTSLENLKIIPVGFVCRQGKENKLYLNPDEDIRRKRIADVFPAHTTKCELVVLADIKPKLKKLKSKITRAEDFLITMDTTYKEIINSTIERESMKTTKVAICHWNEETRRIIEHLQSAVIERHSNYQITVLVAEDELQVNGSNPSINNVKFCYGDPTKPDVLHAMGLEEMDTFVVLADIKKNSYSDIDKAKVDYIDYETLIIAQTASSLKPDIHIVAEVLSSENVELFQRFTNCELVAVSDLTEKLMAQSTITPGLSEVYMRLLTATEDTNEIYFVPAGNVLAGKSFLFIADQLISHGLEIIALGYKKGNAALGDKEKIIINPKKGNHSQGDDDSVNYELKENDSLLVMAYEQPCLSIFDKILNQK